MSSRWRTRMGRGRKSWERCSRRMSCRLFKRGCHPRHDCRPWLPINSGISFTRIPTPPTSSRLGRAVSRLGIPFSRTNLSACSPVLCPQMTPLPSRLVSPLAIPMSTVLSSPMPTASRLAIAPAGVRPTGPRFPQANGRRDIELTGPIPR